MFKSQIINCLSKNNNFLGVFSIDNINGINYEDIENIFHSINNNNIVLISNTAPSYSFGEHWISIVISRDKRGYFFDTYGFYPKNSFVYFLNRFCIEWTYNNIKLQSNNATTCGHWCIDFCNFIKDGGDPFIYNTIWGPASNYNDEYIFAKIGKGCGLCFGQSCRPLTNV